MLTIACPACGADVMFRSPTTLYRICEYCQSMIFRTDNNVRDFGKIAVLPFDVSPIQLGTCGIADDVAFEVIGRVRWAWSDGFWNEWLLLFADGGHSWLAEAMGQFMLLRAIDVKASRSRFLKIFMAGETIKPGYNAQFKNIHYTVTDIKQARCVGGEGELPFSVPAGWTITNVDFRSAKGHCGSAQRHSGGSELYLGRFVELRELQPRKLRVIEGWPLPDYARD